MSVTDYKLYIIIQFIRYGHLLIKIKEDNYAKSKDKLEVESSR
jgi:hypothetical protein